MELKDKIKQSGGFLTMTGSGLDRTKILLFDEVIYEESGFDWGYLSPRAERLGKAVLSAVYGEEYSNTHGKEFTQIIVSLLPPEGFKVEVNMVMIDHLFGSQKFDKNVSAYHLFDVHYGDLRIPKFLDVLNIRFKNFFFTEGTVEYEYLDNMDYADYMKYVRYVQSESKRFDHEKGSTQMLVCSGTNDDLKRQITIKNGLGTEDWHGYSLNDFISGLKHGI